ncbi:MAG TPA: hypothetical protein VGC20_02555, partial [bacterium]
MAKPTPSRRTLLKSAAGAALAAGATLAGGGLAAGPVRAAAPARVPRKALGATGASIPILQMGTSQSLDQAYDKRLHRCLAEGVEYIDTALSYGWGRSHAAIATFLEQV